MPAVGLAPAVPALCDAIPSSLSGEAHCVFRGLGQMPPPPGSLPSCPIPQRVNCSFLDPPITFRNASIPQRLLCSVTHVPLFLVSFSPVYSINICRRNKPWQARLRKLFRLELEEFPTLPWRGQAFLNVKLNQRPLTSKCHQAVTPA